MTKVYELVGKDGALFAKVESTSFRKAREIFSKEYEGNFRIIEYGDQEATEKNVKL